MKKNIFVLCIALFIAVTMSLGAFATEDYYRLQDLTEPSLLTEAESAEIIAMLDEVSERQGVDVTILTVDSVEEGLTIEEDATEWYEYLGYDVDGVMLYINMEESNWYYLTRGYGITAITDKGIDYISEKFLTYLSDGDYLNAFKSYITLTDEFITQAKTGEPYDVGNMPKEPYNIGKSLVISIAIGFIISLIITGAWKGKLKSVALQTRATSYIKPGSLNVTDSRDFFLYRHIDRRVKEKESDGGSSTHKSSSGNTYGGKGGKF